MIDAGRKGRRSAGKNSLLKFAAMYGVSAILGMGVYYGYRFYCESNNSGFLKGTLVDGEDVYGMSADEVLQLIHDKYENSEIIITENENEDLRGNLSFYGYEIDWGQADPANYAVTEELGSLTVDRCPLTIITHSATKRFDGTPLTRRKASIICPIETDIWAGGTGAQTYVGSCYNSVAYDWGTQDPDNFDLHIVYGQLTVKPAK